jgi:hypothetical protein
LLEQGSKLRYVGVARIIATIEPAGLVLSGECREKGYTTEHMFDRFSPNVTDAEIWQYAFSCGGVIVSKD